jgi:L-2-hydroxyglutarate oxidase LhgO
MDYDFVIIGAGVIGLACAEKISKLGHSCLVIERNPGFGFETSSRNSEVIHAGIYYPQNSLKAKLCVSGNRSIYEWCVKFNIPHRRIGKFIIAVDKNEESELDRIFENAKQNGVEGIRKVSLNEFEKSEPNVKAKSVLFSRDTGIINSHKFMASLEESAKRNGTDFAYKHSVIGIEKSNQGYKLEIIDPSGQNCRISANFIVNSAGLDCDTVAELAGIDVDKAGYRLQYCRGHYFKLNSSKRNLVNHLIYPVPNKNSSGLGIHVTIDMVGDLKLGPDTEFLADRKQDYRVDEHLKQNFYDAAQRYIPSLLIEDIHPDQSGIRPKLKAENGEFRDFIIKEETDNGLPRLINLIGIESPGLTASLAIAEGVTTLI